MGRGILWVEFKGFLEIGFRAKPIPIVSQLYKSPGGVRFTQRGINVYTFLRGSFGFRHLVGRLHDPNVRKQSVRISKTGVGQCVAWILLFGLLKVLDPVS